MAEPRDGYSPHLRTALLFAGTGTAGAYHAGVLRALQEAGVKIDLVGGCGMGVPVALFAAIDASAQLSDASGFWRSDAPARLYPIRRFHKFLAVCLAVSLVSVVGPLLAVVAGLVVFPVSFFLAMTGWAAAAEGARGFVKWLVDAFAPGALPSVLPRVAVLSLLVALAAMLVEARRARRRSRQRQEKARVWWAGLGTLIDATPAVAEWRGRVWRALAGGPIGKQPDDRDLSARYSELLADNLGQPRFRELLLVVHDLDARRDLAFALLGDRLRKDFFGKRVFASSSGAAESLRGRPRNAEAFDLAGLARDRLLDVLSASLRLPVATDAHEVAFPVDGYWRGETHRLVHRPESISRLIEEATEAGAVQIIVVTAVAEPSGPHTRGVRDGDARSRIGEYLSSAEGAAVRDAVRGALDASKQIYLVQPAYNPLNALDFAGRYDTLSDRQFTLAELVERGYEDAYRQFIEPVVAAGGEQLGQPTP
ncbi:MAG: patatin-like phospholipase family protein [Bacteroidales bacterium]